MIAASNWSILFCHPTSSWCCTAKSLSVFDSVWSHGQQPALGLLSPKFSMRTLRWLPLPSLTEVLSKMILSGYIHPPPYDSVRKTGDWILSKQLAAYLTYYQCGVQVSYSQRIPSTELDGP